MNNLKKYLKQHKLFTEKELSTLQYANKNNCKLCNKICGSLVKLKECPNNSIICLNCLDNYYDNYNNNKNKNNELFKCLCCDKMIFNYDIIH
jgi:hypothetical protein